jgi:Zn-dependent peptidase ImmA (M78 family)
MLSDRPLRIRTAALGDGRMGLWDERTRTVWLDAGLSTAERRCTLIHELIHAERGDVPCDHPALERRQERRVEREAARRLVSIDALIEAVRWSRDPHEVAAALEVDLEILGARIEALTQAERVLLADVSW